MSHSATGGAGSPPAGAGVDRVVVRAPATSANLGPGFDCLGLALDLWNEVEATPAATATITGVAGSPLPEAGENLILRAARVLFERYERPLPPMALRCANRVPFSRGLGSSAAAIVSGLLVANRWLGEQCGREELLALATQIEGHPDNVTPCLLGGVRVAVRDADGSVVSAEIPLGAPLHAAVFVPDAGLSTELARAALPPSVPFADAVFNVGRASLLVAALAAGHTGALREATRDRLHQPYRAPLFPTGAKLMKAAQRAGALGACSSGAGPSVLALCDSADLAEAVGSAMQKAANEDGVTGQALSLPITRKGAHVDCD